jgi:hypothetical protein
MLKLHIIITGEVGEGGGGGEGGAGLVRQSERGDVGPAIRKTDKTGHGPVRQRV